MNVWMKMKQTHELIILKKKYGLYTKSQKIWK